MKRILVFLLILPALALAQARFGHGAMSPSQMLPIITDAIADSSRWTAGSHIHAIKPRGGKSVQADTVKAGYLNVTGDTQLDGTLTMNTVASESLKVLAGGIRNEGGLRQKGLAQFGATATPVYITADGKLGIGTSTSSPYNAFGLVSATSGRGTGIGLTSSQWNKNRTSLVTASDTSAIGMYIDSAGGPRFFMKGPPETTPDTLGLYMDGGAAYLKSSVGFNINAASITLGTLSVNVAELSLSGILPVASDSRSLGSATKLYQNGYFSDGLYLGSKGQTATMYISGENTIAGTDSSWTMSAASGVPTLEAKFALPAARYSNGGRRTYFGSDTLALFNSARTGRDSTVYVLPTGSITTTGTATIGETGADDPIVISPNAKGTTAYTGTITTTGDLSGNRQWELTDYNGIHWVTGTRFNRPHLIVESDWTAIALTDGSTNYIIGSSLGPITYREEQNKTTRSWQETVTGLNIDADNTTDDEGVEIFLADGVGATLGDGWIVTGTTGGKFEVTFTITDVSATDQLLVGWRSCVAFDGANAYANYVEHILAGITATDGSITVSSRVPAIAGGAQQTDDSGTNITDGTQHILRVEIDASTRVPSVYLDGVAITLTNCGGARTTATAMAPMITYMHGAEAADPGITINRISIWR